MRKPPRLRARSSGKSNFTERHKEDVWNGPLGNDRAEADSPLPTLSRQSAPVLRTTVGDTDQIASICRMSFSHGISLQVHHPDADPTDIARGVGLPVSRNWKLGQPRVTPRGTALAGHYDATYCLFDLCAGNDGELGERLQVVADALLPRRDFLIGLRATGGSINFYITWTVGEWGEMFDCSLLSDLVSLGIDLGIEPIRGE